MEVIEDRRHESPIPWTTTYAVRWDCKCSIVLFTHHQPHYTANVISNCIRLTDPTEALAKYIRLLCELDGPSEGPMYLLRIWRFHHSVMTPIVLDTLDRHIPQVAYIVSNGNLRKCYGPDLIHGDPMSLITLPPPW